jgi:hypothetical protein
MATGADDDSVASHILRCGAGADPEVSTLLRRAAVDAAHHGAPHTAAAYLERALKERAAGDDRGRLLAELATVAFDAGLSDSRERLREALAEAHDRESRLDVLTRLAALNVVDIDEPGLSALFEQELATETDPGTRLAIEVAALDTLITVPGRQAERVRRVAAIDTDAIVEPALRRTVLAHRAWAGAERGAPDAAAVAALAREALDGEELLHDAGRRAAYHLATRALVMADHAVEAHAAIARLRDHAVQRGALRLHAAAAWYAADLAARRVSAGQDAGALGGALSRTSACSRADRPACSCRRPARRIDGRDVRKRGRRRRDGRHAWQSDDPRPRLRRGRGRLRARLAERSPGRCAEAGARTPWTPWAVTAALALAHPGAERSGRDGRHRAHAGRHFGAPVPIAAALRARSPTDDAARVSLCERAGEAAAPRRCSIDPRAARARSALAHMGRRIERATLRPALADADRVGAVLLAQRARRELVATGLRPRQAATRAPP